jgi:DNA-binding MarR family transcriptional regulator
VSVAEELPSELTDALMTASRALIGVAARSLAAAPADVTLPQYRALVVLAARGPLRVGDLAAALGIHPSTATRLCDRLVGRRLVRRAVDRGNRRETTISVSTSGRRVVDDVTAVRRTEIAAIIDRIPAELRQPAVAALVAFAEAAGEPADEAWTSGWS